jgi:micrococcal nuclease
MASLPSLAALALLAALAAATTTAEAQTVAGPAGAGPAYVTRVVEGDTVYAEVGGRLEAVRYLGVNAPRIEHPTRGTDLYAMVAREANRRLVEGKWIRLVFDGQPRDRFGRLLAYVWVDDVFVNAALTHLGFAEAAATTTVTRYGEYFRSLETGARQDARGLWRDPEAGKYHRPRPAEGTAEATEYEERAADASGGRVFSAPAPFIPTPTPGTGAAPSLGLPAGPRNPAPSTAPSSPSYVVPRGSTTGSRSTTK